MLGKEILDMRSRIESQHREAVALAQKQLTDGLIKLQSLCEQHEPRYSPIAGDPPYCKWCNLELVDYES